ncbi:MAG: hypothetical protein IJ890_06110 [Clostridia bacterium]|nr:hypothetical protein [Clostridia bacterium]
MKKEGSLKTILAILVIILLCLVTFGGIYVKDRNIMKNIIPDYVLGMELDDNTVIKLEVVKDDTNSSEDTQEENNSEENNSEDNTAEENTTIENNGQADNKYTVDNYKKTKKIIEERLKLAGIEQSTVRLDEGTGNIVVEVATNTDKDKLQSIFVVGKTEIKLTKSNDSTDENSETDTSEEVADENKTNEITEIIGDNNSVKSVTGTRKEVTTVYGSMPYVEMKIDFNGDAVKKFKEMKNNYSKSEGISEENITITIDGSTVYTWTEEEFLEAAVNGSLVIPLGNTTVESELNEILNQVTTIGMLMKTESLPITYSVAYSNDIHSDISAFGIISVFAVILGVMLIYLLVKYGLNGLYGELSVLGFGAILLLVLRITKVQISVASIVSIAGMLILQFAYLLKILKKEKISSKIFNEKTMEFTKMIIPAFILGIVSAVLPALKNNGIIPGNISDIANFGMVIFWGVILFEVFNNTITRAILTNAKNK